MLQPSAPKLLDIDLSLYAGHYVALVEGRIIAVGDTAEAAHARARRFRAQRPPTILYIETPETDPAPAPTPSA